MLGSQFLNRHNLHIARVAAAMRMASWRRRALKHRIQADGADAYERSGYILIENFLDQHTFNTVLSEIDQGEFDRFDMHQGATITRRSMIDDDDLADYPGLHAARNNTRLRNLVQYVASHAGQPLITLQTVLARANSSSDPQTDLHSDTFHATAKAWLFLTDVEDDDGPFCYVAGSHKMTAERYAWEKAISSNLDSVDNRYARRGSLRVKPEDLSKLGYAEPTRMLVKANTLVIADTHGFHARCASPKNTTRIELYASLRRGPFLPFVAPTAGGLHIAAIPFVKNRVNRLIIHGLALLQRCQLRGNPWQSIGSGHCGEWTHRG